MESGEGCLSPEGCLSCMSPPQLPSLPGLLEGESKMMQASRQEARSLLPWLCLSLRGFSESSWPQDLLGDLDSLWFLVN